MNTAQGASPAKGTAGEMFRCPVCDRLVSETEEGKCPTCETNNTQWRRLREFDHLKRFHPLVWLAIVILLIIAIYLPSIITYPVEVDTARFAPLRIASILAIAISIVVIVTVYLFRFGLRRYQLLHKVRAKRHPGLILIAVLFLGVAVILSMAITLLLWAVFALELTSDFPVIIAVLYGVLFPSMTLALMLVGVWAYTRRLDKEFRRPLYLNINRLARLALNSVQIHLNGEPVQSISIDRNDKGGLVLVVSRQVEVVERKADGASITVPQNKRYEVETDEWGQICSVKEQPPQKK